MLKENKISNARDHFTVEEILFSKGSNERLHVFQAQSGHSLFIIGYKDHLKEVNELVVCDALKLISAASLLWRGAKNLRTVLLCNELLIAVKICLIGETFV